MGGPDLSCLVGMVVWVNHTKKLNSVSQTFDIIRLRFDVGEEVGRGGNNRVMGCGGSCDGMWSVCVQCNAG